MSSTPIGDAFDALDAKEQWAFILTLQNKDSVEIFLDNDATSISFGEIEEDDDGYSDIRGFKNDIGDRQGAYDLLECLGFNAQGV